MKDSLLSAQERQQGLQGEQQEKLQLQQQQLQQQLQQQKHAQQQKLKQQKLQQQQQQQLQQQPALELPLEQQLPLQQPSQARSDDLGCYDLSLLYGGAAALYVEPRSQCCAGFPFFFGFLYGGIKSTLNGCNLVTAPADPFGKPAADAKAYKLCG